MLKGAERGWTALNGAEWAPTSCWDPGRWEWTAMNWTWQNPSASLNVRRAFDIEFCVSCKGSFRTDVLAVLARHRTPQPWQTNVFAILCLWPMGSDRDLGSYSTENAVFHNISIKTTVKSSKTKRLKHSLHSAITLLPWLFGKEQPVGSQCWENCRSPNLFSATRTIFGWCLSPAASVAQQDCSPRKTTKPIKQRVLDVVQDSAYAGVAHSCLHCRLQRKPQNHEVFYTSNQNHTKHSQTSRTFNFQAAIASSRHRTCGTVGSTPVKSRK